MAVGLMLNHFYYQIMTRYYLDKTARPSGNHDIHLHDCIHTPKAISIFLIGDFSSSLAALLEVRDYYPTAEGCKYCCGEIYFSLT